MLQKINSLKNEYLHYFILSCGLLEKFAYSGVWFVLLSSQSRCISFPFSNWITISSLFDWRRGVAHSFPSVFWLCIKQVEFAILVNNIDPRKIIIQIFYLLTLEIQIIQGKIHLLTIIVWKKNGKQTLPFQLICRLLNAHGSLKHSDLKFNIRCAL